MQGSVKVEGSPPEGDRKMTWRSRLLPPHTRRASPLSSRHMSLSTSLSYLESFLKPLIASTRWGEMAGARKAAFATAALGLVCVILLPRGSSIELLTGRAQNGLASSFVSKVYQEDEKAGRRFLQENKDKLHAAGLDDILRDPSMKEYLSVALGSKKFQLNVPNQELKLQGSNSAAAESADARAPHHAVQQVHARVEQQSKGGKPAENYPRPSRTSTAPSFYAAPKQSTAGLNVVYDQFAPGILHGTQRHHLKAVNKARQPVVHAAAKGNPLSAADDSHLFDDNFQESTSKVGKLSQQVEELKREIKEEREKNKELNMKVSSSPILLVESV